MLCHDLETNFFFHDLSVSWSSIFSLNFWLHGYTVTRFIDLDLDLDTTYVLSLAGLGLLDLSTFGLSIHS